MIEYSYDCYIVKYLDFDIFLNGLLGFIFWQADDLLVKPLNPFKDLSLSLVIVVIIAFPLGQIRLTS